MTATTAALSPSMLMPRHAKLRTIGLITTAAAITAYFVHRGVVAFWIGNLPVWSHEQPVGPTAPRLPSPSKNGDVIAGRNIFDSTTKASRIERGTLRCRGTVFLSADATRLLDEQLSAINTTLIRPIKPSRCFPEGGVEFIGDRRVPLGEIIGLERGDVIESVNGTAIRGDPNDALQAYRQQRHVHAFDIRIVRKSIRRMLRLVLGSARPDCRGIKPIGTTRRLPGGC